MMYGKEVSILNTHRFFDFMMQSRYLSFRHFSEEVGNQLINHRSLALQSSQPASLEK